MRYTIENGWPENPELWVSEETASNEEDLRYLLERARQQYQRASDGKVRERIEREMIGRLIAFGNWARADAAASRRMRVSDDA